MRQVSVVVNGCLWFFGTPSTRDKLTIGEHREEVWSGKQNSRDNSPKVTAMFKLDMFQDPRGLGVDDFESVRVFPFFGRTGLLNVGESCGSDIMVNGSPF